MLHTISLIRNIGKFDTADASQISPYEKLALIYAENGRGKTTVCATLKSLSSGNADLILERKRLGAKNAPHVVVQFDKPNTAVFQNGSWTQTEQNIRVFDDIFVAQNVCSGVEVFSSHRKNLHELIIGADGLELSNQLKEQVEKNEEHNRKLKEFGNEISSTERGPFTVEQFCSLKRHDDIDSQINAAKRQLAASQNAVKVENMSVFSAIEIPEFSLPEISTTLTTTLEDIDSAALGKVKAHLKTLNNDGETWVREGLLHLKHLDKTRSDCPFCGQDLEESQLVDLYRKYFSKAYAELISNLNETINKLEQIHGRDAPAAFERLIRETVQRKSFWEKYTNVPNEEFDTAEISLIWKKARDALLHLLKEKRSAPLDNFEIDKKTRTFLTDYEDIRRQITIKSDSFLSVNSAIGVVKEQTSSADLSALQGDLNRKLAIKSRFDDEVIKKCNAYLSEKALKKQTDKLKKDIREKLDEHRSKAFPTYGESINDFLSRFGASFRIGPVDSVNNRAGSSANYTLLINNETVPLAIESFEPSFRNTLSAGDRNTLALAFFFASLSEHASRNELIVVIDDPMTSLDEHRRRVTLQQINRLAQEVEQIIVLSHSKPFLFGVWEQCQQIQKSAHIISRSQDTSIFADWIITDDMVTEHDRRYEKCLSYLANANSAIERDVAISLRLMLEKYLRVSYPNEFKSGDYLGIFVTKCRDRFSQHSPILSEEDTTELRDILDYANKFHHNTNPSFATEIINDGELTTFVKRTLSFMGRG